MSREAFSNETCNKRVKIVNCRIKDRKIFMLFKSAQILPVSGFVSKCVRDLDMCLHKRSKREQRVGVREDLRGKSVPFT